MRPVPCVLFLHLPRTGGTTLSQIARSHYAPGEVQVLDDKGRARFAAMSDHERRRLRFVRGHFRYGFHREFPQRCQYVTLIRDPVDRMVSLYRKMRRTPSHAHHELAKELSLGDYLRRGFQGGPANEQTWRVSGTPKDFSEMTEDDLHLAARNLRRFAVVGVTEQFDDFLASLHRSFDWPVTEYRRYEVSTEPPPELGADVLALIEERFSLDRQLHDYAARSAMR